ncbi:GNAT family N-acetyltransferase [Sporosarcina sp. PTS2304]|uniref:GNAT family N-acetyltransferase n=1 Tax=Sporosarcina sp. PTS2304 TaxID=2283194 RepID=UPI000E0DBCF4|nr:GNAT family N-acetyltransferase [Sporosarcina sp. PTS2304]AXI00815.1 GNAT family N-acetyltransferase [Sporosarcina sp. PTS2304]
MISWNIRKADLNDAGELQKCMHKAYLKYSDRINIKTLPPMNVNYKDEIASFPVWIVEFNNQIIAGLVLVFEEDYASLANIAIDPDFQAKGLGKFLLKFAEQETRSKGYTEMKLATHVLFTENVLFYNKQGWILVDQDETKVYMKKYLK